MRSSALPLVLIFAAACGEASRDDAGQIESAGNVDIFTIQVGDCFNDPTSASPDIFDVAGVPCHEAHDNQVYALFDIPGDEWPGQEEVEAIAEDGCLARFPEAIGASYEESVLAYRTLYPSTESWSGANDREVVCVAYHMNREKLIGSVLGSGS
ncbi:MAG TPA: septum formation family protein [Longimicrobiales bacterium]|nr:septum formation family protein [Longimicrobiales bacterium]